MAKSIKLKDNNYIDSTGIVHNRKNLADILYPVGSIYMSVNNVSPANLIGGTWTQIKDRFLLACGDTYSNGTTGGEATHTLTVDEIPSHSHKIARGNWQMNYTSGTAITIHNYKGSENQDSSSTGGGQAHNNMPPYLAVYCWYRVS